jgi:hypothetical protein
MSYGGLRYFGLDKSDEDLAVGFQITMPFSFLPQVVPILAEVLHKMALSPSKLK